MPGYAIIYANSNHYENDILAMKKTHLLFLFLINLFFSCGNNASGSIDYDSLSQQFCICGQPSIAISNQMQQLIFQDQLEAIKKLAPKASKAFDEAVACSRAERQKYSKSQLNKQVLGRKLKTNCPDMPPKFISDLLEKIN